MNNHGSIFLVCIYRLALARGFAIRGWHITHKHIHIAHSEIASAPTLEEIRKQLVEHYPDAVNVGAHMDDPDGIVETWVIPWGDDARVPQAH